MQFAAENGSLIVLALGAVLVLLSLGQLWFGGRYVDALREHDWELRQMRVSMQQLEEELTNDRTLIMQQLSESSLKLQQLQAQVEEAISLLKPWKKAAEACAAELKALDKYLGNVGDPAFDQLQASSGTALKRDEALGPSLPQGAKKGRRVGARKSIHQ